MSDDLLSALDLSNVPTNECWISRDWRGRKTMSMGCLCPWDEEGSPLGGQHGSGCPWAGSHRSDCDGTCNEHRPG